MYVYELKTHGMPRLSTQTSYKASAMTAACMILEDIPELVVARMRQGGSNEIYIVEIDGGMETTHRLNPSELADFMGYLVEDPDIREGSTQDLITKKCDQVKDLLLRKNADYGNSALDPVRIFSKADAEEQIRVRIDDKLSRLAGSGEKNFTEDTVMDLVGYLILLMVKMEEGK